MNIQLETLRSSVGKPHVYKITNLINNKVYIGKTSGRTKNYLCGGSYIRREIKDVGAENFKKEILVVGDYNDALMNELECHFIQLYASNKVGYNLTVGGVGAKGRILSVESREKISKSLMGNKLSEETKKKLSIAHKGRVVSEETRLKNSLWQKGRKLSEERKKQMSIISLNMSDETKKKMSAAKMGKVVSEETKQKISAWFKGTKRSSDVVKKIADIQRIKVSKEIDLYDLDYNFIKHYASQFEAHKDGFSTVGIFRTCRGQQDSHKNHIFKFTRTEDENIST